MNSIRRTITLTPQDILAGMQLAAKRSQRMASSDWRGRFCHFFVWVALALFFYQALSSYRKSVQPDQVALLLWSVALLAIALFSRLVYTQHVYRQALLNPEGWIASEHDLELTPSSYSVRSKKADWSIPWAAFDAVDENAEYFLLLLKPNLLFMVPKSALTSEQELQLVRDWSRSKR